MFILISHTLILKAGLNNGEEVHWSRILGEWSNYMNGYKMVLHQLGFTLWPRLLRCTTLSMDEKMTWLPTCQHFLLGWLSEDQIPGQPQILGPKTWPLENSNLRHYFCCFSIQSTIPTGASNNLFLGSYYVTDRCTSS